MPASCVTLSPTTRVQPFTDLRQNPGLQREGFWNSTRFMFGPCDILPGKRQSSQRAELQSSFSCSQSCHRLWAKLNLVHGAVSMEGNSEPVPSRALVSWLLEV